MRLVNPTDAVISIALNARSFQLAMNDEEDITRDEYDEIELFVKSSGLVCLSDEETKQEIRRERNKIVQGRKLKLKQRLKKIQIRKMKEAGPKAQ